jgi:hypothetical protein
MYLPERMLTPPINPFLTAILVCLVVSYQTPDLSETQLPVPIPEPAVCEFAPSIYRNIEMRRQRQTNEVQYQYCISISLS